MNSFCVFLSLLDIRISVILRFLAHILRFLAQNFAFCVILRHFAYFASFSPTGCEMREGGWRLLGMKEGARKRVEG